LANIGQRFENKHNLSCFRNKILQICANGLFWALQTLAGTGRLRFDDFFRVLSADNWFMVVHWLLVERYWIGAL
jgi:hypothetical protein